MSLSMLSWPYFKVTPGVSAVLGWFVISLLLSSVTVLMFAQKFCNQTILYDITPYRTSYVSMFLLRFSGRGKQDIRNLVTSLLVLLSAYSRPCSDIICRPHSAYGKDMQQPSNRVLMDRLRRCSRSQPDIKSLSI